MKYLVSFIFLLFLPFVSFCLHAQNRKTNKGIEKCLSALQDHDTLAFRQTYPELYQLYIMDNDTLLNVGFGTNGEIKEPKTVKAFFKNEVLAKKEYEYFFFHLIENSEYAKAFEHVKAYSLYKHWADSLQKLSTMPLRRELYERVSQDQGLRILYLNLPKKDSTNVKTFVRDEMLNIDKKNTTRAKSILDSLGHWPTDKEIGQDENQSLWLMIQHADEDPKVAEKYLPMLLSTVQAKGTAPMYYAYLVDRIALHHGKEQLYGTQTYYTKTDEGKPFFFVVPIKDPEQVDERRKAMGLEPMREYLKDFDENWDLNAYKKALPKIKYYYKRIKNTNNKNDKNDVRN